MHLYLTEQGTKLTQTSELLVLRDAEKKPLYSTPLLYLEAIHLFGNIQVTSQAMSLCASRQLPLSFYTQKGDYKFSLTMPLEKSFSLRKRQLEIFSDPQKSLAAARQTVKAKIMNQLKVLERLRRRKSTTWTGNESSLREMSATLQKISDCEKLLGFEGIAAKKYWEDLDLYLSPEFKLIKRSRRPPGNETNALISFVYSLLFNSVNGLLQGHAYEPFLGFYHKLKNGRYNLALDILEPYRPICDRFTFSLLNKNVLRLDTFTKQGKGCYLNPAGCKKVIQLFFEFAGEKQAYANLDQDYSLLEIMRMTVESIKDHILHQKDIFYPQLQR